MASVFVFGQKNDVPVTEILLPPELSFYDNQFSGLFIQKDKLFLMSESRLQDNAEAKLYSIQISDVEHNMQDTNFVLPYKKHAIYNLDFLRRKIYDLGDDYEGLEAIYIKDDVVYLSVETATPSNNCYLLKGTINDTAVFLDRTFLIPTPKPITVNDTHIYNAGYEAISMVDETIINFFEYNSFERNNAVVAVTPWAVSSVAYQKLTMENIPFRITDITKTGKNTFTAINYFYKGGGEDTVYRVLKKDKQNDVLIRDGYGYKSYCRLVKIKYERGAYTWKPLWEFPVAYMSYNWEGIAAYKNGYFIINDKYTPARPYKTILLYVQP
jgi:hypothetical protein